MAKKPRNHGGAGRARPAATSAGRPTGSTANTGTANTGTAKASTAQLTAPAASSGTETRYTYAGERFGLPEQGPGSVSSMGRRVLALLIDWLLCLAIAHWLFHSQYWTIVVFFVEVYLLTAAIGCTVGKRLLGIRVVRTSGGTAGFGWALLRTLILLTVIPPLLTDRDMRGLHDRASDTIVVRL